MSSAALYDHNMLNTVSEKLGEGCVCGGGGVLWWLTQLSTIFQLYRGSQFYWWRKTDYLKKTTDLVQVLT